jgi:hypothetical protein
VTRTTYDEQDRLLLYGDIAFTYTPSGEVSVYRPSRGREARDVGALAFGRSVGLAAGVPRKGLRRRWDLD